MEGSAMRKLVLAIFLVLASSQLFADQIVLKNGDRLTGTITKSDDKSLILKTDYADDITIQWKAVQEISSTQRLHVATKDGKTVAGPVTTSDGNFVVATSGGNVNVPQDNVTVLRSDQGQAAYEQSLHPPFTKGWAGGGTVGFALTGGNSETKSLALALTADRKTLHDDTSLYANRVYATNDAPLASPATTANATQAGARYAHDLRSPLFGFVNADFQTDALQELNLRSILGGGLGVHIINSKQTTLDLLGGLNYTHESYGFVPATMTLPAQAPISRGFAAVTLGEEFMHKLGASTVFTEKGYFFPDITQPTGEYRATFNVGTATKISKWLGWQNAFGDIYVTNPPLGKKRNDLLLTTGLNVSFTH
jgi:putative salt-induced outer membrane protein YdiY